MRILVTGGAGFAGLHLLRELRERGAGELYATVLADADAENAGADLASVEWVRMDLTSPASVDAALGTVRPDRVYHLAGQSSVGESFADPIATWEVNAMGTVRLADALSRGGREGARLLVVSSAEVYGAVPEAEQPIGESRIPRPLTPYGASKVAAEAGALQIGRAAGFPVVAARSFNHVGPGQDERFFLPSMARQLGRIRRTGGEPAVRTGNLDIIRDFLDVRDVARAYVHLMEDGAPGAVYNVCSGEGRTLHSVVSRLIGLSGGGAYLETEPGRVRAVDIPALVGDGSALRRLGWAPRISLDETLEAMLTEADPGG